MTELQQTIYILVGYVHPPGVPDVPVDDHHLAVVTTVEPAVEVRPQGIEGDNLKTQGAQATVKVSGKPQDGPHIIIEQANLHSHLPLLQQDTEHGIPEFALTDDEELHEDERLCLLEFGKHIERPALSTGKVLHFGVSPYRIAADVCNILGLSCQGPGVGGEGLHGQQLAVHAPFHALLIENVQLLESLPQSGIEPPVSEKQVQKAAVDGKDHEDQHPADLVGWIEVAHDHHQGHEDGES
ncbi:hypothetical protein SDC9_135348 [bioreactor metagenome]|uniref:Uncharacterized protein n=1 Tax=bioreactor metagenome TaxID=1076179 RepID=A0A645DG49_9ZZZZ